MNAPADKHHRLGFKAKVTTALALALFVTATVECLKWCNINLEEPDKFIFDWKVYLFSQKITTPRKDIAIVFVNDDSLSSYPYRSPIDRALLASLVRNIDSFGPKAIGVDVVFDHATEPERDDSFIRAVAEAKAPVVLVATETSEAEVSKAAVEWQEQYLGRAKRIISSPFLDTEGTNFSLGDDVIRNMAPYEPGSEDPKPFALALAEQVKPVHYPESRLIDWLLPSGDGKEVFSTIVVPPHPRVSPNEPNQAVLPAFMKPALANKIVLIGAMISGSDWHRAPTTVATNREVSGTYIHAQILSQLLDGREIADAPRSVSVIVIFAATFILYLLAETIGEDHPEVFFEFALIGLIIVFGTLMFWRFRINFPSAELALMWLVISMSTKYTTKIALRIQRKMRF